MEGVKDEFSILQSMAEEGTSVAGDGAPAPVGGGEPVDEFSVLQSMAEDQDGPKESQSPSGAVGAVAGGGATAATVAKLPIHPLAKVGAVAAGAVIGGKTEQLIDEFQSDEFQQGIKQNVQELNVGLVKGQTGHAAGMIGLKVADKIPIKHPAGKLLTLGLGYLGGYSFGGTQAENALNALSGNTYVKSVFGTPEGFKTPTQKAMRLLGEAGSLVLTAGQKLAAMTSSEIANMENIGGPVYDLMLMFARNPRTAALAEVSSATGAASGTFWAETMYPENHYIRMAAEITLGMIHPSVIAGAVAQRMPSAVQNVAGGMSSEQKAGQYVLKLIKDSGGDPSLVIAALRQQPIEGFDVNLSSAEKSGSEALGMLQRKLQEVFPNMAGEALKRTQDAYIAMEQMIKAKTILGAYKNTEEAMADEVARFSVLLEGNLQTVMSGLDDKIQLIRNGNAADFPTIGSDIKEALLGSLKIGREIEGQLHSNYNKDLPMPEMKNFGDRWGTFKDNNLEDIVNSFPGVGSIKEVLQKMKADDVEGGVLGNLDLSKMDDKDAAAWALNMLADAGTDAATKVPTVKLAIMLRSALLRKARQAAGTKGHEQESRDLYGLSEAVMRDIDEVMKEAGDTAYDTARAFSLALNRVYARSTVGGASEMAETALRKSWAGSPEASELRFADIDAVTRFMDDAAFKVGKHEDGTPMDTEPLVQTILANQERFLRAVAEEVADIKVTGGGATTEVKFSTVSARKMLKRKETLFNRFPAVRDAVEKALTSAEFAKKFVATSRRADVATTKTAFAKLVDNERPAELIRNTINGEAPAREFGNMVAITKKSSKEAQDGLVELTINAAIQHAYSGSNSGIMNVNKFREFLLDNLGEEGSSALKVLKDGGLVNEAFVVNIGKIFDMISRMQVAQSTSSTGNIELPATSLFEAAFARAIGATASTGLAAKVGGGTSSRGLIIAGAGAKVGEAQLSKLPIKQLGATIRRMADNPEYMADLLEKPKTMKKRMGLYTRTNAFTLLAGGGFYNSYGGPNEQQKRDEAASALTLGLIGP